MIADLTTDDIHSEVPDSDQLMEIDAPEQADLAPFLSSQGVEKYQEVVIYADYPKQKVKIGRELSPEEAVDLVAFLQANLSVFAWTPAHMPGIPEEVAIHKLNINPQYPPVQQKSQTFGPVKEAAMKEEVTRLLAVNFIKETQFATWLANVVKVPKPNQK